MPDPLHHPAEQQQLYRLILAPGARRALSQSLPPTVAFAVWEFVSGPLLERPKVVAVPLRPPFTGLWRARRGEYRVRYRINDDSRQVEVVHIAHRRDAYRA